MDTLYDMECKQKYEEMLASEPREPGYSPSQLFSVMVVMRCGREKAKSLIDKYASELDWSECTWCEMRDYFILCTS